LDGNGTSFYHGSAIHVSSSSNAAIYNNYVVDATNGIGGQDSGSGSITGLNVHDNTTSMSGSGFVAGAISDSSSAGVTYAPGSSNVFSNNTYRLPTGGTIPTFVWCSSGSMCTGYTDNLSYSTWHNSPYSMDSGGTLISSGTAFDDGRLRDRRSCDHESLINESLYPAYNFI